MNQIKTATVAACFSEVATKVIEQLCDKETKIVGFARKGDEKRAEELERKYNGQVKVILGDMTSCEDAKRLVTEAKQHLGSIEAHYHCAGVFSWNHWEQVEQAEMQRLMSANFDTAWIMSKALTKEMIGDKRANIIFVSARDTKRFIGSGFGAYMASKMALNGLVESLASEFIDTNISVNAVLPTIINTKVNRDAMPDLDPSMFVDPSQLAKVMIAISGNDIYQMSGALIPVNSKLI